MNLLHLKLTYYIRDLILKKIVLIGCYVSGLFSRGEFIWNEILFSQF